ncbi:MAG: hypothetical protein CM15mP16_10920 [Candidatus Pelagibacterales bacterium]|nr:MAG: hypothetical protein CM15mP16_10920 [Pelagibacterales bacterium]
MSNKWKPYRSVATWIFGETLIQYPFNIKMDKINISYASNVEHNFAQRLIIKTIEKVTGKKKKKL